MNPNIATPAPDYLATNPTSSSNSNNSYGSPIFNYHGLRAEEARARKILNNPAVKILLWLLLISGIVGYIYGLFFEHNSVGWLGLGLSVIMIMLLAWIQGEVAKVPAGKSNDINSLLSANVLALLKSNSTPQTLAKELHKTRSGAFLALRFGLTPQLLELLAKMIPQDLTPLFAIALKIRQQTDSELVSGGILAIAIIESYPDHDNLLRRMKLELSDLHNGLVWYNHLHGLVKSSRMKKRNGGIARDFTFGYIPLLERFGHNISNLSRGPQINLASHSEIVQRMISAFSSGGNQNVALIGPEGSGRSTIVKSFASALLDADSKISADLKYRQVYALDATSLISVANERGQLESLVMQILNEAYAAKNIIICLDNAELFFEEGTGSVDISNILLPVVEAGNLRIIFTMNEQKFLEISARKSSLANSLNKIMVAPANAEETMRVMQDLVPVIETKHNVICTFWALTEAYRLSERYVHDLEMPGKAVSLLESAADFAEQQFVTDKSVRLAVEKSSGVRLNSAQDADDKSRLLNLENLIHQRMIDQVEAVKTVSDALRRAAAGVRNEKRPIGTFLFLGPTGVGKTELAKALSEVYFQGESNIVRLDMNEFVRAEDVNRLLAEGADNADSLTAQVMKQPFSVVLLDEIEKAHSQVLTTLLQLLDEGILRDVNNREVSFRDTIVIATSNAGAEKIRDFVANGLDLATLKTELTDTMIQSGQFKPEFLNRFDEICVFKPLSKKDLLKVVGLILDSVNQTLAPQKISVVLDDEAKMLLVEHGYDPQMGARPMRRIVQKTVENLVAKMVLAGSAESGATIHIDKNMIENELN